MNMGTIGNEINERWTSNHLLPAEGIIFLYVCVLVVVQLVLEPLETWNSYENSNTYLQTTHNVFCDMFMHLNNNNKLNNLFS